MALQDSAELLTAIKEAGSIPVNAGSWTDARILAKASSEIRKFYLPKLVDAKGEYLVKESLIPCVNAQREYLISPRAAAVRLVSFKGGDNVERPLDDLTPRAQSELYVDRGRLGMPLWYNFREGYVQLFPLPMNATDFLKVLWHIRPSRLIVTSDARQIFSIVAGASTTVINFATAVGTALAGAAGTLYDLVGVKNPFAIKSWDAASQGTVTDGVSTAITFLNSAIPTDLAVGDWVAAAGYSPMPNIVEDLHEPLALRTAASIVGSRQSALRTSLLEDAASAERELGSLLEPRSKGNPRKLVQRRFMRR